MLSEIKDLLTGLAEIKAPSPPLAFSMFHLVFALELLSKRTVGRFKLAEKLTIGVGSARNIVRRLKRAGLITSSCMGCNLTAEGLRVWRELEQVFPKRIAFRRTGSTSQFYFAFLIRGHCGRVRFDTEMQVAAIKAGAINVALLVFTSGCLRVASSIQGIAEACPENGHLLFSELEPQDGDVILVACSDTPFNARVGAFTASWSLLTSESSGGSKEEKGYFGTSATS